ncbi:hypothetical protein BIW11_06837 [Tropilaelaps mercedesae]|uniref:Uncharacterized protein n=1 Tax=Tropilaelaps mercedesae TaxID=418985 RepID=A0A1V9XWI5_9ACAR|nr:hypothetical protein BIW11_06837 [Tropilaelaps mercedesae]
MHRRLGPRSPKKEERNDMSNDSCSVGVQPLSALQEYQKRSRILKNPAGKPNFAGLVLPKPSSCKDALKFSSCKHARCRACARSSPLLTTASYLPSEFGATSPSLHSPDPIAPWCGSTPRRMESWIRRHATKVHKMYKTTGSGVRVKARKTRLLRQSRAINRRRVRHGKAPATQSSWVLFTVAGFICRVATTAKPL